MADDAVDSFRGRLRVILGSLLVVEGLPTALAAVATFGRSSSYAWIFSRCRSLALACAPAVCSQTIGRWSTLGSLYSAPVGVIPWSCRPGYQVLRSPRVRARQQHVLEGSPRRAMHRGEEARSEGLGERRDGEAACMHSCTLVCFHEDPW